MPLGSVCHTYGVASQSEHCHEKVLTPETRRQVATHPQQSTGPIAWYYMCNAKGVAGGGGTHQCRKKFLVAIGWVKFGTMFRCGRGNKEKKKSRYTTEIKQ